MDKKYLYDITLDGNIVGDQGDYLFDTKEEAQADANSYIISTLEKEYGKTYEDFEIVIYGTTTY